MTLKACFFKKGQSRPLICLFSFFSHYNFNTTWKSIDGVLWIRTRGRKRNHGAMAATLKACLWPDKVAMNLLIKSKILLEIIDMLNRTNPRTSYICTLVPRTHHQFYFILKRPIPASFCLYSSFSHYNLNKTNWKSKGGVHEIWTCGRTMVGGD